VIDHNISKRPNEIGDKDQCIIEYIITNPGATVELIGDKTGHPVSTVQKRLSRLFQESLLERAIRVVDWAAVGYPLSYWVNLKVDFRALQSRSGGLKAETLRVNSTKGLATHIMKSLSLQYRGALIVQDVIILLGSPADLCVLLRARDHHAVLDFVTSGLRGLGVVESTTTFHAAWSCAEGDLGDQ
jgi:DNA-binding Lrp family transcriptional regulator